PALEGARRCLPAGGDDVADGKAVFGIFDGRGQQRGEVERAETLAEIVPTAHATGDRPGDGALVGELVVAAPANRVACQCVRATATGVEAVELLRLGIPVDDEQVAAN